MFLGFAGTCRVLLVVVGCEGFLLACLGLSWVLMPS